MSGATATERALAVVALISAVAYVLTPASAGGIKASCFAFNARFAVPAVTIGLIVLPLALGRLGIPPVLAVVAILIGLVVDAHVPLALAPAAVTAVVVISVTAVAVGLWRWVPRPALTIVSTFAAVVLVGAGWREQRVYLRDRYTRPLLEEPVEGISAMLRHANHARVAVTGFVETYPLYGVDSSNIVELPAARVGARFVPRSTCRSWLIALQKGRYGYAVTAQQGTADSPAAAWTRAYPGARQLVAAPPGYTRRGVPWRWQLFRIAPPPRVDAARVCAQVASLHESPRSRPPGPSSADARTA
jgi:hypothetical protein